MADELRVYANTLTNSHIEGVCPTHGEQRGCITVTVNFPLVEKYCISCYADWLAANIPRLTSQDTALDADTPEGK